MVIPLVFVATGGILVLRGYVLLRRERDSDTLVSYQEVVYVGGGSLLFSLGFSWWLLFPDVMGVLALTIMPILPSVLGVLCVLFAVDYYLTVQRPVRRR